MQLEVLSEGFSVCKLPPDAKDVPDGAFCFRSRTDAELSLVCPTVLAPAQVLAREDEWRALRVQGTLDFSLVGILARISDVLAERQIPLFAISTYDTDYVLVKQPQFEQALEALRQNGYAIA